MEIRTDLIQVQAYMLCEILYREFLENLKNAGGYCYLIQIKKHYPTIKPSDIKQMEDLHLIYISVVNSFKYVAIKEKALIYLKYRNSPIDYTGVDKKFLLVSKVNLNPLGKALNSSAIIFSNLAIYKKNVLNKEQFYKQNKDFWEFYHSEKAVEIMKKIEGMRKNAKVFIVPEYVNKKDGGMKYKVLNACFYIVDYGSNQRISHYLKSWINIIRIINSQVSLTGTVEFIIISYSKKRAEKFKRESEEFISTPRKLYEMCKDLDGYSYSKIRDARFFVGMRNEGEYLEKVIGNTRVIKKMLGKIITKAESQALVEKLEKRKLKSLGKSIKD